MSKVADGLIRKLFMDYDIHQVEIAGLNKMSSDTLGKIKRLSKNQTKFNLPDGRVVVICEKRGGDRGWFLRVMNQKEKGVEVK